MRKVRCYSGSSVDFHEEVLKSKHHSAADPDYKIRMSGRLGVTTQQFDDYDTRFALDTLEGMPHVTLSSNAKNDFLKLYQYGSQPFQKLLRDLSVDENGNTYPYCPYCDIGESGSLDHILPKDEYPVLCDHPKNLIRSCTICNSKKSSVWLDGGKRKYLDLYIDEIPNVQILFVDLKLDADVLEYEYYVSNQNSADANVFRMYRNTFDALGLAERYKIQTSEEVSSLISMFRTNIKQFNATDEQLKECVMSNVAEEQKRHGVNYWRVVLKMAICDNDAIFNWVKSKAI